jgi:Mrp family chromosome partitioning ATPase
MEFPMADSWSPMMERIVFAMTQRDHRVVGISSPQPASGVSSVCERLAAITALTGMRTVLVDMTSRAEDVIPASVWRPGLGNAGQSITHDADGFDRLTARFTKQDRFKFNNVEHLRQAFAEDLAAYETVIVDTAPVPTSDLEQINGAAALAACDGAILLCMSGRVSRAEVLAAQEAMVNTQVSLLGMVLNEMENPTVGAELAREARRLRRYAPGLSHWLERKALSSALLN